MSNSKAQKPQVFHLEDGESYFMPEPRKGFLTSKIDPNENRPLLDSDNRSSNEANVHTFSISNGIRSVTEIIFDPRFQGYSYLRIL